MNCERKDLAEIMDSVECGNVHGLTLSRSRMKVVNKNEIQEFLKIQSVHKLSWKWYGDKADSSMLCFNNEKGELTWFGYLYQNYMRNDLAGK